MVSPSLPEVHGSVPTSQQSLWKRLFAFAGPAYLVSVGYMDPGNWATDLEGGARFGYDLLWVLVMSNAMAILLQTLSSRLGIVSRQDLAQACRDTYPRQVSLALWVLCEIAIAACDLAEVLGAAIALNLLFHLPLLAGVILTAADTLLVLWFTRLGIRVIEAIILGLVLTIGGCFVLQILLAKPAMAEIVLGLVPKLTDQSLYVAIAILGATVMPHNLYLHSALVQTRQIGLAAPDLRRACRYNFWDSAIALNLALLVNAAILIVAASVFHKNGKVVTEIQQAHELLAPLLGTTAASTAFAIALLCSGQSSTLTGTMAGQIVMEGFLNLRMRQWLRRLITRLAAVIPAVVVIVTAGEKATYQLIILSQVILSLQLPFAVIPLIQFTSDKKRMGEFANRTWVRILAWSAAAVICGLNLRLFWDAASTWNPLLTAAIAIPVGLLLFYILLHPVLPATMQRGPVKPVTLPAVEAAVVEPVYRMILAPLDHSPLDQVAVGHAAALARQAGGAVHLLHVEEGVTSQVYGQMALTAEVQSGGVYLEQFANLLKQQGIAVTYEIVHSIAPAAEIIKAAARIKPDLVVMGAHGHKGIKDLVFGNTINAVRHGVEAPVLIVRAR